MQVTKGTWRMLEQCVPGSLSSPPTQEPGNEAIMGYALVSQTSAYHLPLVWFPAWAQSLLLKRSAYLR